MLKDRINNYRNINKYLKYYEKIGYSNCLKNYKYENGEQTFSIGNKIIASDIIGEGSYGLVFKGYFKSSSNISEKQELKLAIKISEYNQENKLEAEINKKLTYYIIKNKCPHFLLFYGLLVCDKYYNYKNKSSSNSSLKINKYKYKNAAILSENEYFITLTELADGVFYDIVVYKKRSEIIENCAIQCLLSIIFFNTLTLYSHDDTHLDNFLYSNIKPGGYFHYNIYGIDYYLKNFGYLIAINDFGLITPLNNDNIIKDIIYFASKLKHYDISIIANILQNERNKNKFLENIQKHLYSLLFVLLAEKFNYQFTTVKPINSIIINKTPYIIR
jgi:hypothetical protein